MKKEKTKKTISEIPEKKKKEVSELSKLSKEKKTIMITSIKGIPASQYQEIVKKIRGTAIVKFPKKSIISRVLDSSDKKDLKKLKEYVVESSAILFSDIDCFELAEILISKKTPSKAKTGQEAPKDIEIHEGPTELVPGPAISELGALGIQIQIEKGKIHIKESKIIAKKGEKISKGAAEIMGKLGIKPIMIGFAPLAAFDLNEGKIYVGLKIDKEETLNKLKQAFSKSLPFALSIGYISKETIFLLINKAERNKIVIEKFINKNQLNNQENSKEEK